MAIVNNVTRMLAARNIVYATFELPAEKLGALEVSRRLGIRPESVFKTIVLTRDRPLRPLLVLVPGTRTVDTKKVAKFVGQKRVYVPTEKDAETLTGLRAGGISPLALLNKGFTVIIDSAAENTSEVYISGGQRGLQIRLRPSDLAQLTGADYADISEAPPDKGLD